MKPSNWVRRRSRPENTQKKLRAPREKLPQTRVARRRRPNCVAFLRHSRPKLRASVSTFLLHRGLLEPQRIVHFARNSRP